MTTYRRGRRFSSVDEACQFLDLPPDPSELRKRLASIKRAIKIASSLDRDPLGQQPDMLDTKRDLELAATEVEAMANATLLPDLKSSWESYLFRLERAWERTERAVQAKSGREAQSWLTANAKLRRTDPLLQYLKQARNAETHALSSSIDSNRIISISDRFGRPFNLNNIKISVEGQTLVIDLDSYDIGIDWRGEVEPQDPKLQTIVNRGKRYAPPHRHLGNTIIDQHPVAIATLGLNFYKGAYSALHPLLG